MNRKSLIILPLLALCLCFFGCMDKGYKDPFGYESTDSSPRLIISGTVSNEEGNALPGIYVSAVSVREKNEPDLISYNFAVTDTAGRYTIIRYRGRELPSEVTVVATDSSGIYQEKYLFAPVRYDSIKTVNGNIVPYHVIVTADFVLKRN